MLFLLLVRLVRAVKSMSDGFFERSGSLYVESELHGFERALKIVGIDPEMLKGVDTSC